MSDPETPAPGVCFAGSEARPLFSRCFGCYGADAEIRTPARRAPPHGMDDGNCRQFGRMRRHVPQFGIECRSKP